MTESMIQIETLSPTPIDEAVMAEDPEFINAVMQAKIGPVMTPEEFEAWLDQQ